MNFKEYCDEINNAIYIADICLNNDLLLDGSDNIEIDRQEKTVTLKCVFARGFFKREKPDPFYKVLLHTKSFNISWIDGSTIELKLKFGK